jgi:hypothetical protein
MGTTPKYQLPYPELADPADVPTDMHELADAVENALSQAGGGGDWIVLAGSNVLVTDPSAFGYVAFPKPVPVVLTVLACNGDASLAGDKVFAVASPFSPNGFSFWVEGSPSTNVRVNWLVFGTH